MKILFTGDWQAALGNLDRCEQTLAQVLALIYRENISHVVHLGDVKDAFNPVDVRVTNFLVRATTEILTACQRYGEGAAAFYVLRGNHDNIATQDNVPTLLPTLEAAGATIFEDVDVVKLPYWVFLHMVPYFRDHNRQVEAFHRSWELQQPGLRILVFHNEIRGCKGGYSKGKAFTADDICAANYDICIGGHIHEAQTIKPNIHYAGSPFCMDWGEANQEKSFLILSIPERITGEEKRRVISTTRIPSTIPSWYDPTAPGFHAPASWDKAHVRFKVPVYKDPVKEIEEVRARVAAKYKGAILHIIPDFQKAAPVTGTLDIKGSDEDILRDYLSRSIVPEGADADQVVDYLKEYLPHIGLMGVQGLRFKSFEATNTLCFEHVKLALDRKGLTVVTGRNLDWDSDQGDISNGSGKSSLVTLPFLPLTGKTFKGQVDDGWARLNSKKTASIRSITILPDGSELLIIRCRRPASVQVWRDGKEISMGDKNTTQRMIESITNLTWDVLTNSVYIGQREIGSVFGTEKERKELFSRLLGLDRFLAAHESIRKAVLRIQRVIDETEGELEATKRVLAETLKERAEVYKSLAELPKEDPKSQSAMMAHLALCENHIRANDQDIANLEPVLKENQKKFEALLDQRIRAESAASELRKQQDAAIGLKGKGKCPTCGGKVLASALEDFTILLEGQIQTYIAAADYAESLGNANRAERQKRLDNIQEWRSENRTVQAELDELRQSIAKLHDQAVVRAQLKATLEQRDRRVADLLNVQSVHEQAIEAIKNEKRFVEFCGVTVSRNGLPAYLCSIAAPHLNAAASRYSQIFSKGEINIEFDIADGDIDVHVHNLHGGKTIKDQSEGETRLAALIAAFAFRDALVRHNLLILDEPANGLDPVNAVAFAQGLNSVVERFGHVMVIAHSEQILGALEPDYRLECVKEKGITTVREI